MKYAFLISYSKPNYFEVFQRIKTEFFDECYNKNN